MQFPPGVLSKPGDVIVEENTGTSNEEQPSTRWTVLDVMWGKNRWTRHLSCVDLVVAHELADTIQIERPEISHDAAGVPIKQFPSDATNPGGLVIYRDLPARVQLLTKPEADALGMRGSAGNYEVMVAQELNLTREDRIVLPDGRYLDIINYRQAQRLDVLPVIEARRQV